MRWPWVTRREYDRLWERFDALNVENSILASDRNRVTQANEKLVETIVQMKREGFHPVAVVPTPAPEPTDQLPTEILDALDELGLIGAQRAQHEAWAKRRLNKIRDASLVAGELLQGGLVESGDGVSGDR